MEVQRNNSTNTETIQQFCHIINKQIKKTKMINIGREWDWMYKRNTKITEQNLIALGFEKQIEEDEENPFYYYTLNIVDGLYGITDANDEINNDEWAVELNFDCNPRIKFKDVKSLTELINLLNKNKDENNNA